MSGSFRIIFKCNPTNAWCNLGFKIQEENINIEIKLKKPRKPIFHCDAKLLELGLGVR